MGIKDRDTVKTFFRTRYELPKEYEIKQDVAMIMDLDILFNADFQVCQTGDDAIWTRLHVEMIKYLQTITETYLRDGAKIRELLFFLSYRESRSGYLEHKKKTHVKRTVHKLNAEEIEKRGAFDTWKFISKEDDVRVRQTTTYKIWQYERQFTRFRDQLVADLKKGVITEHLGITKIHFVGFQGMYSWYTAQENGTAVMVGSGEADVHFHNVPDFDALQQKYAVWVRSTDTDNFPIVAALPKEWTFKHGLVFDNGLYKRATQTEPAKYLLVDMKKAREDESVNWHLFGVCCILLGNDYSYTICSGYVNDLPRMMRDISRERESAPQISFLDYIQHKIDNRPIKKAKKSAQKPPEDPEDEVPDAADVVWNIGYWHLNYS